MVAGGLGRLADALAAAARDAGAEISLGHDVADIRNAKSRATGVGLADGTEIEARAIVSTLDLKRTYLSLFQWNALPKPIIKRVERLAHGRRHGAGALRTGKPRPLAADLSPPVAMPQIWRLHTPRGGRA